ncbi:putative transcription factor TGA like domain-containing protein [Medicago truncatula]|uniref:Putative transcription factor TGA like domain-containing protein n=1 Tax=Medicago truncatula TaxID=3880 RepID=A0A072V8G1_MEDTR|nr:protein INAPERTURATE POLLEN1 [Medicago truncatula]KEH37658.1 seed dormancy control protein [Medicago truncatula]RHN73725.1 putative transcription factor TGA like domain-containing protein [Medicago truncatula]
MLKSVFNRQKQHTSSSSSSTSRPFKEYYTEWFNTLKNNHLPLLRRSISGDSLTLLSTHVELIHQHFQSYYHTLDAAAITDPSQILNQDWHNSLEKPLLWISDLHPFIFTNLARSFLDDEDNETETNDNSSVSMSSDRPWQIAMAWRNPSETLITRMEQIECGLKSIVPTLNDRLTRAEGCFIKNVVGDWFSCKDRGDNKGKVVLGNDVRVYIEEFVSVVLYANRLRRSVLVDIISAASVYQAALFLEALSMFLIGFKDHDLVHAVEHSKSFSVDHAKDHKDFCRSRCH